jgi:hypothetical protein
MSGDVGSIESGDSKNIPFRKRNLLSFCDETSWVRKKGAKAINDH